VGEAPPDDLGCDRADVGQHAVVSVRKTPAIPGCALNSCWNCSFRAAVAVLAGRLPDRAGRAASARAKELDEGAHADHLRWMTVAPTAAVVRTRARASSCTRAGGQRDHDVAQTGQHSEHDDEHGGPGAARTGTARPTAADETRMPLLSAVPGGT
jgi:hypothetical protein